MRRKAFTSRPIDARTLAEGLRAPGMDTRQWCSYGLVTAGGADQNIVEFDETEGVPFVHVLLEPSKVPVRCRVGSACAGNGEGEWNPFVEGDEVMVLIPEGNERAGCVIVCKLNNAIDRFPMESVAGQDPTTNSFAFQRRRTPFIQEFAGPLFLRTALSEAFISIDAAGTVLIRDGENSAFQMSPDLIGMQGPSGDGSPPRFLFQGDLTGERISLQMGTAMFQMNSERATQNTGQTWLVSPNRLVTRQGINFPAEHVATVEFVLALFSTLSKVITVAGGGDPSTGGAVLAGINAAIAAGGAPLPASEAAALQAGLLIAGATPKPPPAGNVQLLPMLGAVNFLTG